MADVALSLILPFAAFALLRSLAAVSVVDAAAVAAHYGSLSIVTFVAASSLLTGLGIAAEEGRKGADHVVAGAASPT